MRSEKPRRFPTRVVHAGVCKEHQEAAGITQDLIRLSVGGEDREDIRADLDQALAKA